MRVGLGPRTNEFYSLIASAGENALAAARTAEARFRDYPSGPTQDDIKELEHEGDRLTAELIAAMNAQFMMPFDRDDILRLANAVDDVVDAIDNACELLGLYDVETPTRHALEQCRVIVQATEQLAAMLARLKSLRGSAPEIDEIGRLEDEGDRLRRDAVSALFKDDRIDPMVVIRWKAIYEALEEAVDACQKAGYRVGNILVKNA